MPGPRRRLAARRRSRGYTQEDLAYALGVDRSTVARWEAGDTEPQPWLRRTLVRLLAVSIDELATLLDGDVQSQPHQPEAQLPLRTQPASINGRMLEPDHVRSALDAIDAQYETALSAALLAEAGRCHAAVSMLLDAGGTTGHRRRLHQLATRSAILLSQLVWDASGRRDHGTSLQYCAAAAAHAEACGDALADAQIELRRTFIALYSVGRRPDPAVALVTAETARDKSQPLSKALCGVAELHVAEALALGQEYRRCEQALGRAETSFGQQRDDDPAIESYAPTQLGRMAGSCYLFLGAPERAEPLLTQTASLLTDRPKTRSLVLGNVALSHLRQRQVDAACGRLHEAIDLIEESRGGGGLSVVFAATRELYPWRGEQIVQDVTDRLLSLMARG